MDTPVPVLMDFWEITVKLILMTVLETHAEMPLLAMTRYIVNAVSSF